MRKYSARCLNFALMVGNALGVIGWLAHVTKHVKMLQGNLFMPITKIINPRLVLGEWPKEWATVNRSFKGCTPSCVFVAKIVKYLRSYLEMDIHDECVETAKGYAVIEIWYWDKANPLPSGRKYWRRHPNPVRFHPLP